MINDINNDSSPNVEVSDMTKNNPLKIGDDISGMSFKEIDEKVKADTEARKQETVVMPLSR